MVNRAVFAGILTAIIFFSGLSLGFFWDNLRQDRVDRDLDEMFVFSSALFLESQLIDDAGCDSMAPLLDEAIVEISKSLGRYETYLSGSRFDIDSEQLLYRRYLMSNMRYWLFAREFQDRCGWNTSIMLFFIGPDCSECDLVSNRLIYLKKKYDDKVLVFSINMELAHNDPVANTLKSIYNVTTYPTVIVDGKKATELDKDGLEGLACKKIC